MSSLVRDIFSAGCVNLSVVVEVYLAVAHGWLPVLDKELLRSTTASFLANTRQDSKEDDEEDNDDTFALLLTCIYIFIEEPCRHPNHPVKSALYHASRRLFFLLQTSDRPSPASLLTLLQAGLLLVAFELGHGMSEDAYATLAVCISLAQKLSLEATESSSSSERGCEGEGERQMTKLDLCWSGIIMLDRYVLVLYLGR